MKLEWFEEAATPGLEAWWAIEHDGHPAFYVTALMPGDFQPGCAPRARHFVGLDGTTVPYEGAPVCGTCGEAVDGSDLEPVERQSGLRGVLSDFRNGQRPWPSPTRQESCWLCSDPSRKAAFSVGKVLMCESCSVHAERFIEPKKFTEVLTPKLDPPIRLSPIIEVAPPMDPSPLPIQLNAAVAAEVK